MSGEALSQVLTLYAWFPLAAFIFFLLLIARLYERFSGEKTYFRWFAVPVFLFGLHAIYQTRQAEGLWISFVPVAGGILLIALCYRLYRKMLSRV